MRIAKIIVLESILLGAALVACGEEPPPPRFPVTFIATSDPGVPLPGVTLTANGAAIAGQTAPDGTLHVDLTGPEGAPVQIGAHCPAGFREPTDLPMITLRQVVSLDPAARDRGLQVSLQCRPLSRHGVVVIRAGGDQPQGSLPVMIDGREVARTDTSGVAHVALDMAPGASFQVLLATAANPALRPQDPRMTFTFPDGDDLFVFDQRFDVEAPPPRVRRPGRRPTKTVVGPQPILPIRIGPTRR